MVSQVSNSRHKIYICIKIYSHENNRLDADCHDQPNCL